MGGSGADYAVGLAVDSQGQVYLAGNTSSTDFPITSPPLQGTPYGSDSGFIVCLNGSGSAVVYTTSIGPSTIYAMALSSGGNLYLTGLAGSTFPTTLGAYSRTIPASTAAVFAAKLNSNGTNFAFSTFVGPGFPSKISVDSAGSAIIAGYGYQGYPLSPGSFPFGGPSSVVTKLSPDGSQLSYSTTFHLSSLGFNHWIGY